MSCCPFGCPLACCRPDGFTCNGAGFPAPVPTNVSLRVRRLGCGDACDRDDVRAGLRQELPDLTESPCGPAGVAPACPLASALRPRCALLRRLPPRVASNGRGKSEHRRRARGGGS